MVTHAGQGSTTMCRGQIGRPFWPITTFWPIFKLHSAKQPMWDLFPMWCVAVPRGRFLLRSKSMWGIVGDVQQVKKDVEEGKKVLYGRGWAVWPTQCDRNHTKWFYINSKQIIVTNGKNMNRGMVTHDAIDGTRQDSDNEMTQHNMNNDMRQQGETEWNRSGFMLKVVDAMMGKTFMLDNTITWNEVVDCDSIIELEEGDCGLTVHIHKNNKACCKHQKECLGLNKHCGESGRANNRDLINFLHHFEKSMHMENGPIWENTFGCGQQGSSGKYRDSFNLTPSAQTPCLWFVSDFSGLQYMEHVWALQGWWVDR